MPAHAHERQPFVRPPELSGGTTDASVAVVGAGPVGLAVAVDLALHGVRSVVLDDNDVVSVGSRAICWAKRTLEIFDRLGVGGRMLEKGVTWKVGRLFHGDEELFRFDLLPEDGHRFPAFVNLQQPYVEQYLIERARAFPDLIDLRFRHRVTGHAETADGVRLAVETPDGPYGFDVRYLVACDGARSPTRGRMGLPFDGETFEEKFLIADVEMPDGPFGEGPTERRFWFDPTFHPGKSALLHRQPDDVYRIDLQLDPGADAAAEAAEERVVPRIRAMVGDRPFRLDWVSVYTFRCARLERFVYGRTIFAGDSAHLVSPFGARGGNGGIHDADNLGWKLAAVVRGEAPEGLLATYDEERGRGADENIACSSRATRFMQAAEPEAWGFRQAILALARSAPAVRGMINSGRLSQPCALGGTSAVTDGGNGTIAAGAPCPDAPLGGGWLLSRLGGRFSLLAVGTPGPDAAAGLPVLHVRDEAEVAARYGRGVFLVRPDQHVAAVFGGFDAEAIRAAHRRALARGARGAPRRAAGGGRTAA